MSNLNKNQIQAKMQSMSELGLMIEFKPANFINQVLEAMESHGRETLSEKQLEELVDDVTGQLLQELESQVGDSTEYYIGEFLAAMEPGE